MAVDAVVVVEEGAVVVEEGEVVVDTTVVDITVDEEDMEETAEGGADMEEEEGRDPGREPASKGCIGVVLV